jgi:transcriptional regulator with XRE-family HTH domain
MSDTALEGAGFRAREPESQERRNSAVRNWAVNFAAFLRDQLNEQGLRQADLAVRADVDPARVSNWVSEENPSRPKRRSCAAVARALNLDEDMVLREAGYSLTNIHVVPAPQAWQSLFELYDVPADERPHLQEVMEVTLRNWKGMRDSGTSDPVPGLPHNSDTETTVTFDSDVPVDYSSVSPAHMIHPDHRFVWLAWKRESGQQLTQQEFDALSRWAADLTALNARVCYHSTLGYHRVSGDPDNQWSHFPIAQICTHHASLARS